MDSFTLLFLLVSVGMAIIAIEAATELITKSAFFKPFRWIAGNFPFLGGIFRYLLNCGYCASVWVAILPAIVFNNTVTDVQYFFGSKYLGFLVWLLVLHRLANFTHDFKDKFLDKFYSRNHYSSNEKSTKEQ
jgi:hypothetical protein